MTLRAAVVQFAAGTDKDANLKNLRELTTAAARQGVALTVAPEYAMYTDLSAGADLGAAAEPLDGPFTTALRELAVATGTAVVAGMIERLDGRDRVSNTLVAVAADGATLGIYRKLHLYDAFGHRESDQFEPGPHAPPLTFDLGGLRVGAMTCYDLRFPEMARTLVDAGAQAIVVPAAWMAGPAKETHWETLLRARAIENTSYVLGAGQTGARCSAQSMIVDPMGVVVAGAGESPGVAAADLTLERLEAVRAKLPSLAHRRFRVAPDEP